MMTYPWYVAKLSAHLPGVHFPGHWWDPVQHEDKNTFSLEQFLSHNTKWVSDKARQGIKGSSEQLNGRMLNGEKERGDGRPTMVQVNKWVIWRGRDQWDGRRGGECIEKISPQNCWVHKGSLMNYNSGLIYLIWLRSLWWTPSSVQSCLFPHEELTPRKWMVL